MRGDVKIVKFALVLLGTWNFHRRYSKLSNQRYDEKLP